MRAPRLTGPTVEQSGLPGVQQGASVNDDMFGAAQARGMIAAGRGLQQAAEATFAISRDMQREVDEARVRDADTGLTKDIDEAIYNPKTGYRTKRGKDALDALAQEKLDQDFEHIIERHGKGLTTEQANQYKRLAKRRKEAAVRGLMQYAQDEGRRYVEQTAIDRISVLTDEAATNYADETIVRRNINTALVEVREMRDRNGWSKETANVKAAEIMDSIHLAVATRMAEDDLEAARAYVDRNKGEISADKERRVVRYLDAHEEVIRRRQRADAQAAEKTAREANARLTSDLEIDVRRGEAGIGEIEKAYADGDGFLTPAKRTQLIAIADAVEAKEQKRMADIGRVSAALNGTGPAMDNKDTADRKAVDAYFEAVFKPSLAPLPPSPDAAPDSVEDPASWLANARQIAMTARNKQAGALVEFVRSTGVIPTELESTMRTMLQNGTATQRAQASDFVARIRERNPMLLNGFSKPERQLATQIDRLVKSGVPASRAVEIADTALKADPAAREERQLRLRADKLLDNAENIIKGEMAGGFMGFGKAETTDALIGEYRALFREHFLATGDEDAAKTLTVDDLKRVWGVSRVGGEKRLMKYPPENYGFTALETDANAEWMQDQLGRDLLDAGFSEDDIEAVRLESDIVTARSTDNPTWPVMLMRDGVVEPLMIDGKPMRWRPDWNGMLAKWNEEEEAEKANALQDAKTSRAALADDPGPMVP
tara:strand:+ start:8749 stop:10896 length:2148 start_codon:yes stop_codon:yes gene_type:complete